MITDNYIKMCEQAEEIQKAWEPVDWDGFIYKNDRKFGILGSVVNGGSIKAKSEARVYRLKHYIWLPTQEQLQEMILNHGHQGYDNSGIATMLSLFSMDYKLESLTFTELWLCYVMYEKYHLTWTGEKWVKAE